MVNSCCIRNCPTRKDPSIPTSFHRFPKNSQELCTEWIAATGLDCDTNTLSTSRRVCSLHFVNEDFYVTATGRIQLKSNAVPSALLPGQVEPTFYEVELESLDFNDIQSAVITLDQGITLKIKVKNQELVSSGRKYLAYKLDPPPVDTVENNDDETGTVKELAGLAVRMSKRTTTRSCDLCVLCGGSVNTEMGIVVRNSSQLSKWNEEVTGLLTLALLRRPVEEDVRKTLICGEYCGKCRQDTRDFALEVRTAVKAIDQLALLVPKIFAQKNKFRRRGRKPLNRMFSRLGGDLWRLKSEKEVKMILARNLFCKKGRDGVLFGEPMTERSLYIAECLPSEDDADSFTAEETWNLERIKEVEDPEFPELFEVPDESNESEEMSLTQNVSNNEDGMVEDPILLKEKTTELETDWDFDFGEMSEKGECHSQPPTKGFTPPPAKRPKPDASIPGLPPKPINPKSPTEIQHSFPEKESEKNETIAMYPFGCTEKMNRNRCTKHFASQLLLDGHIRKHHLCQSRPYKCSECPVQYAMFRKLAEHISTSHPGVTVLNRQGRPFEPWLRCKCNWCPRRFRNAADLNLHIASKHNPKEEEMMTQLRSECLVCGKGFKNPEEVTDHFERIHEDNPNPFTCEDCQLVCYNSVALRLHVRNSHPMVDRVKCFICKTRSFPSEHHLNTHIYTYHPKSPLKCPHCELQTIVWKELEQHKQSVHKNIYSGVHCCEVDGCGMQFKLRMQLQSHIDRKHVEKRFGCVVCGKKFTTTFLLKEHEGIHGGLKFTCRICRKRFVTAIYLSRHIRNKHPDASAWAKKGCRPDELKRLKWKSVPVTVATGDSNVNHNRSSEIESPQKSPTLPQETCVSRDVRKEDDQLKVIPTEDPQKYSDPLYSQPRGDSLMSRSEVKEKTILARNLFYNTGSDNEGHTKDSQAGTSLNITGLLESEDDEGSFNSDSDESWSPGSMEEEDQPEFFEIPDESDESTEMSSTQNLTNNEDAMVENPLKVKEKPNEFENYSDYADMAAEGESEFAECLTEQEVMTQCRLSGDHEEVGRKRIRRRRNQRSKKLTSPESFKESSEPDPSIPHPPAGKPSKEKKLSTPARDRERAAKKPFACTEDLDSCKKRFASQLILDGHIREDHLSLPRPYRCSECPSEYNNFKNVALHIMSFHPDITVLNKHGRPMAPLKLECTLCPRRFKDAAGLNLHISSQHNPQEESSNIYSGVHRCEVEGCGKQFNLRRQLNAHINRKHKEKTFECLICTKKYTSSTLLKKHEARHGTGGRGMKWICKTCRVGFDTVMDLSRHLERKHPDGPDRMLPKKGQRPAEQSKPSECHSLPATVTSEYSDVSPPNTETESLQKTPTPPPETSGSQDIRGEKDQLTVIPNIVQRKYTTFTLTCVMPTNDNA